MKNQLSFSLVIKWVLFGTIVSFCFCFCAQKQRVLNKEVERDVWESQWLYSSEGKMSLRIDSLPFVPPIPIAVSKDELLTLYTQGKEVVVHRKVIRDETKALAGEVNINSDDPKYLYYHSELDRPLKIYDKTAPWDTVKIASEFAPVEVGSRKEQGDSTLLVNGVEMPGKAFEIVSKPSGKVSFSEAVPPSKKVLFSKAVPKEIQIPIFGMLTTSKTGGILYLQNIVPKRNYEVTYTATLVSFKQAPDTFSFSSFRKLLN